MNNDHDMCGIDGNDEDVVTVRTFNRFMRRVMGAHVVPLKQQVEEHGKKIDRLDNTINEWLVRLDAGMKTLRIVIIAVGIIVALVVWVANFPQETVNLLNTIRK